MSRAEQLHYWTGMAFAFVLGFLVGLAISLAVIRSF